MKIAHIIHPVVVSKESDLYQAQPITFQSMQNARHYAEDKVNIELYACKYSDEETLIPGDYDFQYTRDLDRHIALLKKFRTKRKLAILKDILERLYEATDADYLIYTNVDIALVPHFYTSIQYLIDQGYDAFAINRRTVPDNITDINLLYTFAGKRHEGVDCFVFKRELYPLIQLNNICIGTAWIDRALMGILICHAQNFAWFRDMHLTFHLGDNKSWRTYQEYKNHNWHEHVNILDILKTEGVYQHDSSLLNYTYRKIRKMWHPKMPGRIKRAIRYRIKHRIVRWLSKLYVSYMLENNRRFAPSLMSDWHLLDTSHHTKDAHKKTANMKIAHIIHPVVVSKESDLYQAQPITFQSMQNARHYAEGKVNIELYACKYSDEETLIPGDYDFQYTRDIDRHIALLKKFKTKCKLAILQDILERLYEATDADYLIYTNADIALVPHFYTSIQYLIGQGYDAFAISRRNVPDNITDINLLYTFAGDGYEDADCFVSWPEMTLEDGFIIPDEHVGADCFVFKRELYPLMRLNNICIGTAWIDDALLAILTCHAQNFAWFRDMHLTFHLGNNKIWRNYQEYQNHNRDELANILDILKTDGVYKHDSSLLNDMYDRLYPPKITMPGRIKSIIKHKSVLLLKHCLLYLMQNDWWYTTSLISDRHLLDTSHHTKDA